MLRNSENIPKKRHKKTNNPSLTNLGVILIPKLPKENILGKLTPKTTNTAKIIKGAHPSSDEMTSYVSTNSFRSLKYSAET